MLVINQKALSEDISPGISGKDERPAETQVPEAEIWNSDSEAYLEALWNSCYNVSCFTHFGLAMRNHYCILQTDIICCSNMKLLCSIPWTNSSVRLIYQQRFVLPQRNSVDDYIANLFLDALKWLYFVICTKWHKLPVDTHHVQWSFWKCLGVYERQD